MKRLAFTLAVAVAALAGCSHESVTDDSTQHDDLTASPETGPAPAAGEWARCWLQWNGESNPDASEHRLRCAGPANDNALQPTSVALSSTSFPALKGQTIALKKAPPSSTSPDPYRRGTFELGWLPDWLFPLPLRFQVQLPAVARGTTQVNFAPADDEGTEGPVIDVDLSIDPSSTVEAPLVVKQPFALWALDIEAHNTTKSCTIHTTSTYDVSIAPFKHHRTGKDTLGIGTGGFEFDSTSTDRRTYFVAAPPSGRIEVNYWGAGAASMKAATLTGPGAYVATDDGLAGPASKPE